MGPHRGVFKPASGLTGTDIAPPVGVFDTLSDWTSLKCEGKTWLWIDSKNSVQTKVSG